MTEYLLLYCNGIFPFNSHANYKKKIQKFNLNYIYALLN